jgi:hypothetical protein
METIQELERQARGLILEVAQQLASSEFAREVILESGVAHVLVRYHCSHCEKSSNWTHYTSKGGFSDIDLPEFVVQDTNRAVADVLKHAVRVAQERGNFRCSPTPTMAIAVYRYGGLICVEGVNSEFIQTVLIDRVGRSQNAVMATRVADRIRADWIAAWDAMDGLSRKGMAQG